MSAEEQWRGPHFFLQEVTSRSRRCCDEILPALFRLESRVVFTSGIDITALRGGGNDQLECSPILGDWMVFRLAPPPEK